MHVTYHKAMADIHEHGDDPEAKRYTHAEGTCLRAGHLTEVENMLAYLVAGRSKYVSCLPTA